MRAYVGLTNEEIMNANENRLKNFVRVYVCVWCTY